MRRAFVEPAVIAEIVEGTCLPLPADVAHRLTRVLRLHPGTAIELFDGRGRVVRGTLALLPPQIVDVTVQDATRPLPPLIVAQAVVKTEKLEQVVRRATELGASDVLLFEAARSQVHLEGDRADRRVERLARVAEDAARQCERAHVPIVEGPLDLDALTARARAFKGLVAVGALSAAETLSDVLARMADLHDGGMLIVVGPEGGLTSDEVAALVDAGAVAVRLGAHVLRTETAALAALAAAQCALGSL